MAQMADSSRSAYPPPQDYGQGYPPQHSPPRPDDSRSSYPPPPDANRQGQYPPAPQPYPPPQQWAGQPQGQQHYSHPPPAPQHYEPQHAQYHYPPPPSQPGQPPAHPDAYRLPPISYPYHYAQYQPPPPQPAPRQRTAIACKYCRKRKIRCSGYDSSPDGRCQNCVRFNQQCLFHPVSSQAAFVPASALYGPGVRAPTAGGDGQGQNGQAQPMLYGAHGQPLGPAGPGGQPQINYAPPPPATSQAPPQQYAGYPPAPYHNYPPASYGQAPPPVSAPAGHPASAYDQNHQAPPPTASSDRSDRGSLKRGPPDEDPHNESNGASHSPHPNARPRHSQYEGRPSGSFDYQSPTSPANSTMSYQSYPPTAYGNGAHPARGNNSPPAGLTPNSIHSLNSPHSTHQENRTPPPVQPGSAGSSQNGRSGMKVHEMLGGPNHVQYGHEQRAKNDNDMLSKLDGKK